MRVREKAQGQESKHVCEHEHTCMLSLTFTPCISNKLPEKQQ